MIILYKCTSTDLAMYRLYNEVEVSMYTVGTDTELYNRLVPWGIATHLRSIAGNKKRTVRTCTKNHFAVIVQISLRGDRNAELLETLRSNSILMNTVNELDGLRV